MSNPYSSPDSDVGQPSAYQTFDFEATFTQAWTALTKSLWTLVAATLLISVTGTASMFLIVVGWIFLLPAIAMALWAQGKVRSNYNKYSQVASRAGLIRLRRARRSK